MNSLIFEYSYRQSEEEELEPLLIALEEGLGGIRKPYFSIQGAIDLVTLLRVVVSFTAGVAAQAVIGKYLEGLLGGDKWKELGDRQRQQITAWLLDVKSDIAKIIQIVEPIVNMQLATDKQSLALHLLIGPRELFVVLNHYSCSTEILRNLPSDILEVIRFLIENPLTEDIAVLQLYFDKTSKRWRYLLAPSSQGFGRWIDRYIDLETKEVKWINSRRRVLEIFQPDSYDEYKFLVSPFIPPRR
jgi:hypothetical protein